MESSNAEARAARLRALRSKIAEGIAQADRGELIDGDVVFDELRRKARGIAGEAHEGKR